MQAKIIPGLMSPGFMNFLTHLSGRVILWGMGSIRRKQRSVALVLSCSLIATFWGCYASSSRSGQWDADLDSQPEQEPEIYFDPVEEPDLPQDLQQDNPADEEEEPVTWNCGNGIVEPPEQCDDGNSDDCDGCTASCLWERAMQADFAPGAMTAGPVPCQLCPLTIEAWFRFDPYGGERLSLFDIPGYISIALSGGGYDYLFGDGYEECYAWDSIPDWDSWHHFAFVCSWRNVFWGISTFFDGEHVGEGQGRTQVPPWTCDGLLSVATNYREPYSYLPGAVDDLRISSEGLYSYGESFVPELHPTVRANTVALWRFNEDVGGRIPDMSGNGYDLELFNGVLVADECHAR